MRFKFGSRFRQRLGVCGGGGGGRGRRRGGDTRGKGPGSPRAYCLRGVGSESKVPIHRVELQTKLG